MKRPANAILPEAIFTLSMIGLFFACAAIGAAF